MSDKIIQQLETLNPRDIDKVLKLINKLANKHTNVTTNEPEPQIQPTSVTAKTPVQARRGPVRGQNLKKAPRQDESTALKRRQHRKPPKTEEMHIGPRPNLFLSSTKLLGVPHTQAHLEDIEIDKKLQVKPPVGRRELVQLYDVTCSVCGQIDSIPEHLLPPDKNSSYKCNGCASSAG